MMRELGNRFGRLWRDRSGSSALEMALIAPILGVMVFGAMDIANGFAMKLALEQAAGRTIERAIGPGVVAQSYAGLLTEAAAAYTNPTTALVVDNWLECNGVRNASFDGSCATGQSTARYVSVSISGEYVPYFNVGGLFRGSGQNGGYITTGDAVVRIQ